jgi:hypothetical protein
MLRSANINGLLAADVTIGTVGGIEVLKIFIEVSKTDQGREGHTIYLGKADNTDLCPLGWFRYYITLRNPQARTFFHAGSGDKTGALSPENVTARLRVHLTRIGVTNEMTFASHSLRRMGASNAAHEGIPRDLIETHGGWAPGSKSLDLYIDDAIERQLTVAKAVLSSSRSHSVFQGETNPPRS